LASSSSADSIEGAEMVEFQSSSSSSGSSSDQLDIDSETRQFLKKKQKLGDDDDGLDAKADGLKPPMGKPKPRGKVRRTEEQRKKRHAARHREEAKELQGWRRYLCTLWRYSLLPHTPHAPHTPHTRRTHAAHALNLVRCFSARRHTQMESEEVQVSACAHGLPAVLHYSHLHRQRHPACRRDRSQQGYTPPSSPAPSSTSSSPTSS